MIYRRIETTMQSPQSMNNTSLHVFFIAHLFCNDYKLNLFSDISVIAKLYQKLESMNLNDKGPKNLLHPRVND